MASDPTSWTIAGVGIDFPGSSLYFTIRPWFGGGCYVINNFTLPTTVSLFPTGYTITLGGDVSLVLADVRLTDDENLASSDDVMICIYEETGENFCYT